MKSNHFIGILCLALVAVLQSCNQNKTATPLPTIESEYTAIDARGLSIQLEQPAQRVVVLYEPFVDALFMLEAQDRLVGIPSEVYVTAESYDFFAALSPAFAAKSIATPTFNGTSVNIETLMALQPDLVVTFSQDEQTIAQIEDLGITVYTMIASDIETTLKEFEGLATLLGKAERATMLTDYLHEEIKQMNGLIPDHPKTAYYVWSKGRVLSTSGKGTLIDATIRLAGLENACPLEMEAPNIGVEVLYQWNPDLIVLWNTPVEDVYELKELAKLPAVVNKQIFEMKPIFLFDPHTIKQVLFAKQIKQWAYPNLYPQEVFEKEIEEAKKLLYNL